MPIFRRTLLLAMACFSLVAGAQTEPVGVVVRLLGEAKATNTTGIRPLKTNDAVLQGDALQTADGARLLVRFADDSTLTLGPNAHAIVDKLAYAASGKGNAQTLDILRGVFRFASGKIGKLSNKDVLIRTPSATAGIRGTEFVGGELTVGMRPGRPHYGFQIRVGAIDVIAPGGTVTLANPGEGTFLPLTRIAAPSPVRQWTAEEAAEVDAALAF